jgi:hypothetical protein
VIVERVFETSPVDNDKFNPILASVSYMSLALRSPIYPQSRHPFFRMLVVSAFQLSLLTLTQHRRTPLCCQHIRLQSPFFVPRRRCLLSRHCTQWLRSASIAYEGREEYMR